MGCSASHPVPDEQIVEIRAAAFAEASAAFAAERTQLEEKLAVQMAQLQLQQASQHSPERSTAEANAAFAAERVKYEATIAELRAENERLRAGMTSSSEQQASTPLVASLKLSEAELADEVEARSKIERETAEGRCTFFFVDADVIRNSTELTFPDFQALRERDGAIVEYTLSEGAAYRSGYTSEFLGVSHRWEEGAQPDRAGEQMAAVQAHLREHKKIRYVWYDFWCMPQGKRTPADKLRFKHMLSNVNLIYLGMRVLILMDISYLSRFWTQFEAWLSMQAGTSAGLGPPRQFRERRETIVCLHNATAGSEDEKLRRMWEKVTPAEAHALLSKPDVTVTNQSDKAGQLVKIANLDDEVRTAWGASAAKALFDEGALVGSVLSGFSRDALGEAGIIAQLFGVPRITSLTDMAAQRRELKLPPTGVGWHELLVGGWVGALVDEEEQKLLEEMGVTAMELLTAKTLNLSRKGLGDCHAALVGAVLEFSAVLKVLGLENNNIGDAGAAAIANAIAVNAVMTELRLGGNQIGDQGATAIAEALKVNAVITTLNLYYNKIGDEGAKALASALEVNAVMETLYLHRNNIGDAGAIAIAEALKVNAVVTELSLHTNNIGDPGAIAIAKALEVNAVVTFLKLESNEIGDTGAIAIAEALKFNAVVTKLSLSANNIGDPGAIAIAKALEVNAVVTELHLGNNNIGDAGAAAIANAIAVNAVLKTLGLSYNNIGDAGAIAIAESLKVNAVITSLNLYNNKIGDEGAKALASALEVNAVMKILRLNLNKFGADAQAALQAAKKPSLELYL